MKGLFSKYVYLIDAFSMWGAPSKGKNDSLWFPLSPLVSFPLGWGSSQPESRCWHLWGKAHVIFRLLTPKICQAHLMKLLFRFKSSFFFWSHMRSLGTEWLLCQLCKFCTLEAEFIDAFVYLMQLSIQLSLFVAELCMEKMHLTLVFWVN